MLHARTTAGGRLVPIFALVVACGGDDERPATTLLDGGMDAGAQEPAPDGATSGDCREPSAGDYDRDGYRSEPSVDQLVDCDDCDPLRGPDALDVPGNGIDENCDGVDAPVNAPPCAAEDALDADDSSPESVARALGVCKDGDTSRAFAYGTHWGLLRGRDETRWQRLGGSDALEDTRQVWLPERFGTITPRQGSRLVVLSTGVARDATKEGLEAGYTAGCDTFTSTESRAPEGFPIDSSACPKERDVMAQERAYNDVGFTLTVRTPTNARAIAFDSMFLTYEYPDFVCSDYNDFFVVLMEGASKRDYEHGNVLFDADENPIGVNSSLLAVCRESDRAARDVGCDVRLVPLLKDTGYDRGESTCAASAGSKKEDVGGAATGWLHTEVKVEPGARVTLRFLLWDSGDPLLDSTVLLDNFQFLTTEPATLATTPVTGGP